MEDKTRMPELKPLIESATIKDKVQELGRQITEEYRGTSSLLCVGILKGSIPFFADLMRTIDLPVKTDFICVSSYGKASKSSGVVKMVLDLDRPVDGQDVLLVEDIIDTGLTVRYLLTNLATRNPKSVKVASLLLKETGEKRTFNVDYVGFTIPNKFVVGYGLDYAEQYRNLPYIAEMPAELIKSE